MLRTLRNILFCFVVALAMAVVSGIAWLKWDAGKPLASYFASRHGQLVGAMVTESRVVQEQQADLLRLTSDSGLTVTLRAMRKIPTRTKLPVLLILGGHRTGSDAVDLFDDVGERAIVAIDYPYAGPEKVKGIVPIVKTIPLARQAFRDTPPAVSLVLDWLSVQEWVDAEQVVIVGASLGVPFAALAAARDTRIQGVMLVHGAADNRLWLEAQLARRDIAKFLRKPVTALVYWLTYGPTFDTHRNVALIAPRPVLIAGAKDDERTPAGQTELLFAAAGQPKWLRWTEGAHIEPDRSQIIDDLLQIADEMLPFPAHE